jgi:hypothetical protein
MLEQAYRKVLAFVFFRGWQRKGWWWWRWCRVAPLAGFQAGFLLAHAFPAPAAGSAIVPCAACLVHGGL